MGEMEGNCHFIFPRTIHLFTHHSLIYSVNKIVRLSEASRPMIAAKNTESLLSRSFQLAPYFYPPSQDPIVWDRAPLGANPDLVLSSLRPKGLVWAPAQGSLVLSFIEVWLPQHHTLPRQWGYFQGRHGGLLCCSHSESELQRPKLWFSSSGKPTSMPDDVLSHIITQVSIFPPVNCNLQTVNSARKRPGTAMPALPS